MKVAASWLLTLLSSRSMGIFLLHVWNIHLADSRQKLFHKQMYSWGTYTWRQTFKIHSYLKLLLPWKNFWANILWGEFIKQILNALYGFYTCEWCIENENPSICICLFIWTGYQLAKYFRMLCSLKRYFWNI